MRKKRAGRGWLAGLICAAVVAAGAAVLAGYAGEQMDEQELALLERQVRQAAVSCYASEGRYPQALDYLEDHYGLTYDEERYSILYDAFASNIMPDIAVSVRENGP